MKRKGALYAELPPLASKVPAPLTSNLLGDGSAEISELHSPLVGQLGTVQRVPIDVEHHLQCAHQALLLCVVREECRKDSLKGEMV